MHTDLTWWVYLITAIISTSGTALFLWWIIINRFRASFAFTYTTLDCVYCLGQLDKPTRQTA